MTTTSVENRGRASVRRAAETTRARSTALDAFRGLAILAMMVDHLALFSGADSAFWLRLLPGRLAMPMFFVLAGHLAGRRPGWRWVAVLAVGVMLPAAAPWIDSPNVLVWWCLGGLLVWACKFAGVPVYLLAVLGLGMAANGWGFSGASGYDGFALVGLMSVGSMIPRSSFAWAGSLPVWVAVIGRAPLRWYVGHVLVLTAAAQVVF